jgi:hypothetical protein
LPTLNTPKLLKFVAPETTNDAFVHAKFKLLNQTGIIKVRLSHRFKVLYVLDQEWLYLVDHETQTILKAYFLNGILLFI